MLLIAHVLAQSQAARLSSVGSDEEGKDDKRENTADINLCYCYNSRTHSHKQQGLSPVGSDEEGEDDYREDGDDHNSRSSSSTPLPGECNAQS